MQKPENYLLGKRNLMKIESKLRNQRLAFICYEEIPANFRKNQLSNQFTFSEQYKFLSNQGHLVTSFEKDLQEIAEKNNAIGIRIINLRTQYDPHVSSVSLDGELIFDKINRNEKRLSKDYQRK